MAYIKHFNVILGKKLDKISKKVYNVSIRVKVFQTTTTPVGRNNVGKEDLDSRFRWE